MKFPEGENITWLSSHLMARLFLMVIKRTWGIFFLCVTNLMLAFLSSLNHFVLFISNSSPVIRWGDLLNVSGDWGSNHVPFNVTWKLVPMMLYYFFLRSTRKTAPWFSLQLVNGDRWRLAFGYSLDGCCIIYPSGPWDEFSISITISPQLFSTRC